MIERENRFLDVDPFLKNSTKGEVLFYSNNGVEHQSVESLVEQYPLPPEIATGDMYFGPINNRLISMFCQMPLTVIKQQDIVHQGWSGRNSMDNPMLFPEKRYARLWKIGNEIRQNTDYFLAINKPNIEDGYCAIIPKTIVQSHAYVSALLPKEGKDLTMEVKEKLDRNIEHLFSFFLTLDSDRVRIGRLLPPQENIILEALVRNDLDLEQGGLMVTLAKAGYSPETRSYEPAVARLRKILKLNGLIIKYKRYGAYTLDKDY